MSNIIHRVKDRAKGNKIKKISLAIALAIASVSAQADQIIGLYNTGQGFTASMQDTHYTLNGSGNGYVAANNSWPVATGGPWVANTATSSWLTPLADSAASFDPSSNGTYTWTTTFDLTGYDATTASLSGQFSADNAAVAYLNNYAIGISSSYRNWSSFASTSGDFLSGVNTLSFVVTNFAQNSGNPTGIRAEFISSDVVRAKFISSDIVAVVPEPETYAMLLSGLGLLGFTARRRKDTTD